MVGKINHKLLFARHQWSSLPTMFSPEIAVTVGLATTEDVDAERQRLHAVHIAIMARFATTNTLSMKKRIRIGNRIRKKTVRRRMKPVTRIEVAQEIWSPR